MNNAVLTKAIIVVMQFFNIRNSRPPLASPAFEAAAHTFTSASGPAKVAAARAILHLAASTPNNPEVQARANEATFFLVRETRQALQTLSMLPAAQLENSLRRREALTNAHAIAQGATTAERRSLGHYFAMKLGKRDVIDTDNVAARIAKTPYIDIPRGPRGALLYEKAVVLQKEKAPTYRKTTATTTKSYDMASLTYNGTFGQVRFARVAGQEVAIKVQRTHPKIGVSNLRTVQFRDVSEIAAETVKAIAVPQKIDGLLAKWGFAKQTARNPFAGVRAQVSSVVLRDAFVDEKGKVHQVTDAHDGSLLELRDALDTANRDIKVAVIDSVAAQAFTELEAMHNGAFWQRQRFAHRDLKLDNMVYNGQGSVKLIDFDTTEPTDWQGFPNAAGKVGTTMSPEMVANSAPRLGLANDVWAMSASIFELFHASEAAPSPFLNGGIAAARLGKGAAQAALLKAFPTYRELALQSADLRVSAAAFNAKVTDAAQRAAKGRLDAFFAPATALHPSLARELLQRGMHTDPNRRNAARTIAKLLRGRLPALGTQRAAQVRGFFSDTARRSQRVSLFARLENRAHPQVD